MLRAQAEAFEDSDDEEQGFTGNLTDTQPLSNVQGKFILLLEGLSEIRNNMRVGAESLSNFKPERLTGLLNNLLEIGTDLNKEQLIQIRGLLETIFNTADKRRLVKDNNVKFTTILLIYSITLFLIATYLTQDKQTRKTRLNDFFELLLNKTPSQIGQILTERRMDKAN